MSRPVVIAFFAVMAGIGLADYFLYDADWLATSFTQASWVLLAPWGLCVCVALAAFWCYRHENHTSIFARHSFFPWLTTLFFLSLGFGRYALTAEHQHCMWAVEGKPAKLGNPDEFDFARWDWIQGIPVKPWKKQVTVRSERDTGALSQTLQQWGGAVRNELAGRLKRLDMPPDYMAVILAMTLGDRSELRQGTRDLYAAAGASHLLALSGLHLGIIVGLFLSWMNGRLLLSRWRKFVGLMIIVFIWAYCVVAGLPTSLVRASLMTSVFVVACLFQRYGDPLQHLLLTGLLMLLVRPLYLFDVGAQLSFASLSGILLFYRPLYHWCFEHWRFQVFWLERYHLMWGLKTVAVSLCAQVLTWPLVACYFHQIPVYGVLLSVVLIPLTTLLIYGALLMLILTFVWPALASMLSVGLTWLVAAQCGLMAIVMKWPYAVINDFWSQKAEPQVVVYHNRRCPALHIIASPEQSWLLMPEPEKADSGMRYIRKDFWKRRLKAEPKLLKNIRGLEMPGLSVIMANEREGRYVTGGHGSKKVDVLWITRGYRGGDLGPLGPDVFPRLLVLDASLPRWQRAMLARAAWAKGWKVYDVAEQGALRFKLPL